MRNYPSKLDYLSLLLTAIFVISGFLYISSIIKINDLINISILLLTAWFIGMQSFATENMAAYQVVPAVDVNMIYDERVRRTYFWFSNSSSLSGFVHLKYKINRGSKMEVYKPLRIAPLQKHKKTATTFDFSQKEGDQMILYASIEPAINKTNVKFEFEKSYSFIGNKWIESSWSYPDQPFPGFGY